MFSKEELERYNRQIILPNFGLEGQEKLKSARVLVIGAGGRGAPILFYLVAAGVGKIGIIDNDDVDFSNLHRQVLFSTDDIGKSKVETAKKKLNALNPNCEIITYKEFLSSDNAIQIAENYDIIVDGTDNFPTRYLVNDLSVKLGIPNVHGSIHQFSGQVSVFNMPLGNEKFGPNYRDVYPEPPAAGEVPSCAEGGVLGVLPGIVGSVQAMETIKVITGIGKILSGKIWMYNAFDQSVQFINFEKNEENKINSDSKNKVKLIDYELFCGIKKEIKMKTISASELVKMQASNEDFQLIDVREPHEFEENNMNGLLIPMNEIPERYTEILKDKKVIVHCHAGVRSANVISYLEKTHDFTNLYNLEGGIVAWLIADK
jgi:adenylyltransferase/sulfurtransferase